MNWDNFALYYGCIGLGICLFIFVLQGIESTWHKREDPLNAENAVMMILAWPLVVAMLIGYGIGQLFKKK